MPGGRTQHGVAQDQQAEQQRRRREGDRPAGPVGMTGAVQTIETTVRGAWRRVSPSSGRRGKGGAASGASPRSPYTRTGSGHPLTFCSPRGSTRRWPGSRSTSSPLSRIGCSGKRRVSPSSRLATFTAAPTTVYSSRWEEPRLPAITSPTCRPMPWRSSGCPSAAKATLSSSSRRCIVRAARTAARASTASPRLRGTPNSAIRASPMNLSAGPVPRSPRPRSPRSSGSARRTAAGRRASRSGA